MTRGRCNFYFSFWAFSCPFTPPPLPPPLTAREIKKFTKMKKTPGDNIILHICTKNYDHMKYSSGDVVRNGRTNEKSEI